MLEADEVAASSSLGIATRETLERNQIPRLRKTAC